MRSLIISILSCVWVSTAVAQIGIYNPTTTFQFSKTSKLHLTSINGGQQDTLKGTTDSLRTDFFDISKLSAEKVIVLSIDSTGKNSGGKLPTWKLYVEYGFQGHISPAGNDSTVTLTLVCDSVYTYKQQYFPVTTPYADSMRIWLTQIGGNATATLVPNLDVKARY